MFTINEFRHEAERCRRLAKDVADRRTAEILRDMAAEYDEKARALEVRSFAPANEDRAPGVAGTPAEGPLH